MVTMDKYFANKVLMRNALNDFRARVKANTGKTYKSIEENENLYYETLSNDWQFRMVVQDAYNGRYSFNDDEQAAVLMTYEQWLGETVNRKAISSVVASEDHSVIMRDSSGYVWSFGEDAWKIDRIEEIKGEGTRDYTVVYFPQTTVYPSTDTQSLRDEGTVCILNQCGVIITNYLYDHNKRCFKRSRSSKQTGDVKLDTSLTIYDNGEVVLNVILRNADGVFDVYRSCKELFDKDGAAHIHLDNDVREQLLQLVRQYREEHTNEKN